MPANIDALVKNLTECEQWIKYIETLPQGRLVINNFERELVLNPQSKEVLSKFFNVLQEKLEKELRRSSISNFDHTFMNDVVEEADLYLKGVTVESVSPVGHVTSDLYAGLMAAQTTGDKTSEAREYAQRVCEEKASPPEIIYFPWWGKGYFWLTHPTQLLDKLEKISEFENRESVLDFLGIISFEKGWAVLIQFSTDEERNELRQPTTLDSQANTAWRKDICDTHPNWGMTVDLSSPTYQNGCPEVVAKNNQEFLGPISFLKAGETKEKRRKDVDIDLLLENSML